MEIVKREYLIELYDIYGCLLTDKQKEYFEDYYFMDLSLSEIASNYNISRNGVHDQIKRVESNLILYEEKLQLHKKYNEIAKLDEKGFTKDAVLSILKEE